MTVEIEDSFRERQGDTRKAYIHFLSGWMQSDQPEALFFKVSGLVDDDPQKSFIHSLGADPRRADEIMTALRANGKFPDWTTEAFIEKMQDLYTQRQDRDERRQDGIRWSKFLLKTLAIVNAVSQGDDVLRDVFSVAFMFLVWEGVDRARAYPDELYIARTVLLALSIQYLFLLPNERVSLDPQKIIKRTFSTVEDGDEVEEKEADERVGMVSKWSRIITESLDAGVKPIAILELLDRKWQNPWHLTKAQAAQYRLKKIEDSLEHLVMRAKQDGAVSIGEEKEVERRRNERRNLAQKRSN